MPQIKVFPKGKPISAKEFNKRKKMEYDMTSNDVDRKQEGQIVTVEIILEGKVVYSKAVFIDDLSIFKGDIDTALYYYDEAK